MCTSIKPCSQDGSELVGDSSLSKRGEKCRNLSRILQASVLGYLILELVSTCKNLAVFKICNLHLNERLLKRRREDPLSVKSAKYLGITSNVFVLRYLTVTLASTVPLLFLGKVTCLITHETSIIFSLVTVQGKK